MDIFMFLISSFSCVIQIFAVIFYYWIVKSIFNSREALRRITLLEKEVKDLNKAVFQGPATLLEKEKKIFPLPEIKKEIPKPAVQNIPPVPAIEEKLVIENAKRDAVRRAQEISKPAAQNIPPVPAIDEKPIIENVKRDAVRRALDWERFAGVQLFSWIGGFALFLGMVFFVKYSIDHGWISPWVRVLATFALGTGCVLGGIRVRKKEYHVTSQSLCAAGVAILYANTFAAHSVYHFMPMTLTFAFMTLLTFLAFLLAVRLDSKYIAILGLLGGFLTPPLLSTGVDHPFGLFTYIALLDTGLAAVALHKRWGFLVAMSACGTLLMEGGWTERFFSAQKLGIGISIFSFFSFFFVGVRCFAWKIKAEDIWISKSAGLVPLLSLFFGWTLLSYPALGLRPGVVLGFVFVLDTLLTALVLRSDDFRIWHFLGGGVSFLILLYWTANFLTPALLPCGLTFFLLFCVLHSVTPVLLRKFRPETSPLAYGQLYSVLMLIPFLIPLARDLISSPVLSSALWLVLLVSNLFIVFAALVSGALWVVVLALIFSLGGIGVWILQTDTIHLSGLLGVTLLFGIVFIIVLRLWPRLATHLQKSLPTIKEPQALIEKPQALVDNWPALDQMTALAGFLPFTLLLMTLHRLPLESSSSVFGCGLLFSLLLLGIVVFQRMQALTWVAFLGASLLLFTGLSSHLQHFTIPTVIVPTVIVDLLQKDIFWSLIYFFLFFLLPFVFRKKISDFKEPWIVSAFSGPVYFYLIYKATVPSIGTAMIGFLPACFAGIFFAALIFLIRNIPKEHPLRQMQLAMFGGMTLFFVSLIFPLQFEKEWITLGWALEAVCLLWLYQRVPHSGLKTWSAGLLLLAFARLACNPAILQYHAKTLSPILNWYLYAYGLTALCLIVAAKIWRPANQEWGGIRFSSIGYSLSGILLFLLLNLEIADFFSTNMVLTFRFSGSFAEDMSYTLGWAAFAFALLLFGIYFQNRGARFTSLVLFLVSVSKLFFHDLWRLGQLYRVASFIGLAITLMLVSFLYQRFLPFSKKNSGS